MPDEVVELVAHLMSRTRAEDWWRAPSDALGGLSPDILWAFDPDALRRHVAFLGWTGLGD